MAVIAGVMALSAPTAGAAGFHPFLETFGSANQPSFTNAKGLAVDQSNGDVLVIDSSSVSRWNPDGTAANFSALGTNVIDGQGSGDETPQNGLSFGGPKEVQVAVDNSGGATNGDIYVTQVGSHLIDIFASSGTYLGQLTEYEEGADASGSLAPLGEACGVAVDSAGAVYVGDYNNGVHKYVPSANPPVNTDNTANFTFSELCTLAAGAGPTAGFVFADTYNGELAKLDSSTGEKKYTLTTGVTTVSVDPVSGRVYAIAGSELEGFRASGTTSASLISSDTLASEGQGVAVRGSSGNVYVSRAGSAHLEVFGPLVPAPQVTAEAATGISASEATLHGTVNPEGVAITECKFEYGLTSEAGFSHSAPCEGSIPTDSSDHPVSADITGLVLGAQYRFRLVAKNSGDLSTSSDPETFRIGAAIAGTGASVGSDEATLRGAIIPGSGGVSYKFEWGSTSAYGNATSPANLPAGEDPVAVSAVLVGLTPGASYHFRLVTTSGAGPTLGPDQAFTTSSSLPQPPHRAYELVSPYPTAGVPVFPRAGSVAISEDGDRVTLGTFQPFPGSETAPPQDQEHVGDARWNYISKRGADGWHLQETGFSESGWGRGWSDDGRRYLFTTATGGDVDHRLDPDDQNGDSVYSPGGQDIYQWQPDGSVVWISRDPRIPVGTPQTARENAVPQTAVSPGSYSMSSDGRTVVFNSQRSLSDDDTSPPGIPQLYKWHDGELSFIGKRPDGSVPSQGTGLGVATAGGWTEEPFGIANIQSAVSRDGRRVVFSAYRRDSDSYGSGGTIYIQTDGQATVEAVKETGVPPLPPDQPFYPRYYGASVDASRVFFTTNSRLTPNSGASATWPGGNGDSGDPDLYVYDINADKVRDLTPRLDGIEDPTVDPAAADRAHVLGVPAYSQDGKRVYFVANAQYDAAPNPEGDLPSPEGRNLYLAELDGIDDPIKLRFIAALGADDSAVWGPTLSEDRSAYASPSGSVLGFGSSVPLTGQNLGGTTQLFVYDAEAETLVCASCASDGSLPVSNVNGFSINGGRSTWQERYTEKHWVSSKGQVFFDTATPLVPEDQNLVADVYEYLAGQLRLVSAGAGTRPSTFENATENGDTVLINTLDALVPQDEEPGIPKLYAARVGGGFPVAAKTPACDLGAGACEATGTNAPGISGAGSAAFDGPGNQKAKNATKKCPKGKRRVKRRGKVRCAPSKTRKHSHKRNAKHDRRASR